MATYRGNTPISKQDLKRAKLEAKRTRAAKMASASTTKPSPGARPLTKRPRRGGGANPKLWVILGAVALLLTITGMTIYITMQKQPSDQDLLDYVSSGTFGATTTIAGVNVSGQTLDQAREALTPTLRQKLDDATISFSFDGQTNTKSAMALGVVTDIETILVDALLYEKTGSILDQNKKLRQLEEVGQTYSITLSVDEAVLVAAAASFVPDFVVEPIEPQMSFNPDAESEADYISWNDEKAGYKMDKDAFVTAVLAAVQSGNYNLGNIATTVLEPQNTKSAISSTVVRLSQYTTFFGYGSYDDKNRVFNIEKMAELLTGQTVAPNQDWSINDTTGERSDENGWKSANAIRKGVLVKELGGGVCQVSGTLYNAFLLADLGIVERHSHTYPSDYINKMGRYKTKDGYEFDYVTRRYDLYHIAADATIDFGRKDLVVRNILSENIYLVVQVDKEAETITASVYGPPRTDDYQVVIRTILHEELSHGTPEMRIAENGIGPNGLAVPVGSPLAWPSTQDGAEYWTYKYYYPKDYDFKEDENPYSWIGYQGSDFPNSGEKYRIQYEDSERYIDSLYPAQSGIYYYNPNDPATEGMAGSTYVPPAVTPDEGADATP